MQYRFASVEVDTDRHELRVNGAALPVEKLVFDLIVFFALQRAMTKSPIGRALVHALAAMPLDPQNAYARCWLAIVHLLRGENDKFEAQSQLALGLNPNDPETLADVGHYLAFMGEFERGAELKKWNAAPDDLEHILAGLKRAGLRD